MTILDLQRTSKMLEGKEFSNLKQTNKKQNKSFDKEIKNAIRTEAKKTNDSKDVNIINNKNTNKESIIDILLFIFNNEEIAEQFNEENEILIDFDFAEEIVQFVGYLIDHDSNLDLNFFNHNIILKDLLNQENNESNNFMNLVEFKDLIEQELYYNGQVKDDITLKLKDLKLSLNTESVNLDEENLENKKNNIKDLTGIDNKKNSFEKNNPENKNSLTEITKIVDNGNIIEKIKEKIKSDNSNNQNNLTNDIYKNYDNINIKNDISEIFKYNKIQENNILDIEQMINKISFKLQNDSSKIEIQLEPKYLGKLSLEITDEKGVILAKISVDNYQVKEMIESSFAQLKDSLEQEGLNIEGFEVSVRDEEQQKSTSDEEELKRSLNDETEEINEDYYVKTNPGSYIDHNYERGSLMNVTI